MFDFSVMLLVKLPVVETTQTERNKFATGVENKGTGDSNRTEKNGQTKWSLKAN